MDRTANHASGAGRRSGAEPELPDLMGRELADGPQPVEATLAEIERLRPQLDEQLRQATRVVLVGTGASLAAGHIAAPLWRRHGEGRAAQGSGRSTVVLVRQSSDAVLGALDGEQFRADDLAVIISQSGTSPETLAAAGDARAVGAAVLAVTAERESPLGALASLVLPVGSGVERSAAAKSALATVAGLLALAGSLLAHEVNVALVGSLLRATVAEWTGAATVGRELAAGGRLWWLGYGMSLGIAEAVSLLWHEKVVRQEMAATPSEFRHGLIEAAKAGDAVGLIDVDSPTYAGAPTSTACGVNSPNWA